MALPATPADGADGELPVDGEQTAGGELAVDGECELIEARALVSGHDEANGDGAHATHGDLYTRTAPYVS